MDLSALVKAYDVRGTVPDQLNEDIARAIGAAFIDVTGGKWVNADTEVETGCGIVPFTYREKNYAPSPRARSSAAHRSSKPVCRPPTCSTSRPAI